MLQLESQRRNLDSPLMSEASGVSAGFHQIPSDDSGMLSAQTEKLLQRVGNVVNASQCSGIATANWPPSGKLRSLHPKSFLKSDVKF